MPSSTFFLTVLSWLQGRRIAGWILLGLVVALAVAIRTTEELQQL